MRGRAGAVLSIGILVWSWTTTPAVSGAAEVVHQAWAATAEVAMIFPSDDDNTYVAAEAGSESARSFVTLALRRAEDERIGSVTVDMVESGDSLQAAGAAVAACATTAPVQSDGRIDADEAPETDCARRTDGVRGADGVWTFDVSSLVTEPEIQDVLGIALLPDVGSSSAAGFRVGFIRAETTVSMVTLGGAGRPGATATPRATASSSGSAPSLTQPRTPSPVPSSAAPPQLAEEIATAPDEIVPRTAPLPSRSASVPAAGWIVVPLLALLAVGLAVTRARGTTVGGATVGLYPGAVPPWRLSRAELAAVVVRSIDLRTASWAGRAVTIGALGLLVSLPLLGGEAITFKFGLVLIFAIAAMGLHVLVNWAGQLSLAHAAMVGVPAFVVAKLSFQYDMSPLVLLPLAPIVGAAFGALVALPALKVRGLYVTIVTLAMAIVVDRFLFAQQWLVGSGSFSLPEPTFAGIDFGTSARLYPVLGAIFLAVVAGLRALHGSRAVRAMLWAKANPDAASAAGIDRGMHKMLAYTLAGMLAGLAGGLTSVWVLRVTPTSFPLNLSFTYLLVVVLAGPGSVGGVIQVAAGLEAGRLIFSTVVAKILTFAGPLSLIFVLTRIPTGVNGHGRALLNKLRELAKPVDNDANDVQVESTIDSDRPSRAFVLGVGLIIIGFSAIALAWYHTGNTDQLWIQLQEIALGGIGGLALVVVGTGVLVRDKHEQARATMQETLDALLEKTTSSTTETTRPLRAVRKK